MAVGKLDYTPSKTIREFMLSDAKIRAEQAALKRAATQKAYRENSALTKRRKTAQALTT